MSSGGGVGSELWLNDQPEEEGSRPASSVFEIWKCTKPAFFAIKITPPTGVYP